MIRPSDNYVFQMSGGRTSAYMTIEGLKQEEYKDALVFFENTGKEHLKTLDFVHQVDQYIFERFGKNIIWLEYNPKAPYYTIVTYETASRDGEPFAALIAKRKVLPNRVARFCTAELKVRVCKNYLQRFVGWKHWTCLIGIRHDEPSRWAKSKGVANKECFEIEHPLVRWQVYKKFILQYWGYMPFNLEIEEWEGNCDICFLKGKKKKLTIARLHPERFAWWVEQEQNKFKSGKGGRFCNDYTYGALLNKVLTQPELFPQEVIDSLIDDSIDCFCNID